MFLAPLVSSVITPPRIESPSIQVGVETPIDDVGFEKQGSTSSRSRNELGELIELMGLDHNCSKQTLVDRVSALIKKKMDKGEAFIEVKNTKYDNKISSVWDNFDIHKVRNSGDRLEYVEPVKAGEQKIGKIRLVDVEPEVEYCRYGHKEEFCKKKASKKESSSKEESKEVQYPSEYSDLAQVKKDLENKEYEWIMVKKGGKRKDSTSKNHAQEANAKEGTAADFGGISFADAEANALKKGKTTIDISGPIQAKEELQNVQKLLYSDPLNVQLLQKEKEAREKHQQISKHVLSFLQQKA
ncbi:hypothetical protein RIF29_20621 [Crotalaria pallida]|uniref:SAP domain-containing protein n=1 Tax=Crotalaria pallida TaxID=3830 RepID=A0AAN9I8V4_CROPI